MSIGKIELRAGNESMLGVSRIGGDLTMKNSTETCGTKDGEWFVNPEWAGPLTPEQRRFIAAHERLHVQYNKRLDAKARAKHLAKIEAFEKGETECIG